MQQALQQQELAVQQEGLARVEAAQKQTDEAVAVGQQPVVSSQQIWQAPALCCRVHTGGMLVCLVLGLS